MLRVSREFCCFCGMILSLTRYVVDVVCVVDLGTVIDMISSSRL